MFGFYSVKNGSVFIGFGPKQPCEHCAQMGHVQIRQGYQQYNPYYIPGPWRYSNFSVQCASGKHGIAAIRKAKKVELAQMLSEGSVQTKQWFETLGDADKEKYLKVLHRNGFYELEGRLQAPSSDPAGRA